MKEGDSMLQPFRVQEDDGEDCSKAERSGSIWG